MYRLLLWLFPRDIRREFGADMEELFDHHRRRARGFDVVSALDQRDCRRAAARHSVLGLKG